MKDLIESIEEACTSCPSGKRQKTFKDLYDAWKPETDEGRLYKDQLGKAISGLKEALEVREARYSDEYGRDDAADDDAAQEFDREHPHADALAAIFMAGNMIRIGREVSRSEASALIRKGYAKKGDRQVISITLEGLNRLHRADSEMEDELGRGLLDDQASRKLRKVIAKAKMSGEIDIFD